MFAIFPDKERKVLSKRPQLLNEYIEFLKNQPLLHNPEEINKVVRFAEKAVRKFHRKFPPKSLVYNAFLLFPRFLKKIIKIRGYNEFKNTSPYLFWLRRQA